METKIVSLCDSCYENMNDDFNTPKVIASLFELVSLINGFSSNNKWKISKNTFEKLIHTFIPLITIQADRLNYLKQFNK